MKDEKDMIIVGREVPWVTKGLVILQKKLDC